MKVLHQEQYGYEIERCSRIYKEFEEAAPFIRAVVAAIIDYIKKNPDSFAPPELGYEQGQADQAMRDGRSLELNPPLDRETVSALFKTVCAAASKAAPAVKKALREVSARFDQLISGYPPQICRTEFKELIEALTKETALEKDMAVFLYSMVLSTIYRRQLEPISEVLRTDLWEGGDCPLCGEKPHYGILRAEDGAKQLECWLCGTEWVHTRIMCPFCNNQEQEELGYFTAEDAETCRVNFCQACRRYYKLFDARKFHADGGIMLAIHNLATLIYDLLARREGFTPGSGLEWVNKDEITEAQD